MVFDNDVAKKSHSSVHAEIAAIGHRNVRGATVYIARSTGRLSRPCNRCYAELIRRGVKEIVYSSDSD